jgi:hypothetical protein
MMTKTLGEFLEEGLANVKAMDDFLSCMTDFELSVWEDIIDFAEEAFGLNEDDLIRELGKVGAISFVDGVIEPITRRFWASKLN